MTFTTFAGYSVDGRTVYIDRHLPRSFRWLMKTVRVDQFLLMHEIVEKALLDELRLHYIHAHQIAVRASAMRSRPPACRGGLSALHETARMADRSGKDRESTGRPRSDALSR